MRTVEYHRGDGGGGRRGLALGVALSLALSLAGCAVLAPATPPAGSQPYWGKPTTHFVLPPQAPPEPQVLNLVFLRVAWWDGNLLPFRSVAVCPLTVWSAAWAGCFHVYDGVKIDSSLAQEAWTVYHVPVTRYVYVFTGMNAADDHSEQFAIGWHRLDARCVWQNMGRC